MKLTRTLHRPTNDLLDVVNYPMPWIVPTIQLFKRLELYRGRISITPSVDFWRV